MVPRVPTWWQRLLANRTFPIVVIVMTSLVSTGWILASIGPVRYALADIWATGLASIIMVLAFFASLLVVSMLANMFISPIMRAQGLRNGGPYQIGDMVQVISGPHRNRIVRVISFGQHETYHLDLGEKSTSLIRDYGAWELLRIDPSVPTDL